MKSNLSTDLTSVELQMFSEIHLVFKKYHGQTRDFAMQLLHQHFQLTENEILHEINDKNNRTLLIRPLVKSELPIGSYPTAWKLKNGDKYEAILFCCEGEADGTQ